MQRVGDDPVAAPDFFERGTGDVDGAAFAGAGGIARHAVFLDSAHTNAHAARRDGDAVANADFMIEHGAGDDGTASGNGECPVNRIAQLPASAVAGLEVTRRGGERFAQLRDAFARVG